MKTRSACREGACETAGQRWCNMYEKLHIYDRSQAVLYAVRKGLVEI